MEKKNNKNITLHFHADCSSVFYRYDFHSDNALELEMSEWSMQLHGIRSFFFLLWNGNMNRIICNPFYATITYTESHWNQIQLATPYKNSALCWRFCISTFRLRIDKMFDFIWINAHLWKLIDLSICHCTGLKLKTSLIISMCCAYSS